MRDIKLVANWVLFRLLLLIYVVVRGSLLIVERTAAWVGNRMEARILKIAEFFD